MSRRWSGCKITSTTASSTATSSSPTSARAPTSPRLSSSCPACTAKPSGAGEVRPAPWPAYWLPCNEYTGMPILYVGAAAAEPAASVAATAAAAAVAAEERSAAAQASSAAVTAVKSQAPDSHQFLFVHTKALGDLERERPTKVRRACSPTLDARTQNDAHARIHTRSTVFDLNTGARGPTFRGRGGWACQLLDAHAADLPAAVGVLPREFLAARSRTRPRARALHIFAARSRLLMSCGRRMAPPSSATSGLAAGARVRRAADGEGLRELGCVGDRRRVFPRALSSNGAGFASGTPSGDTRRLTGNVAAGTGYHSTSCREITDSPLSPIYTQRAQPPPAIFDTYTARPARAGRMSTLGVTRWRSSACFSLFDTEKKNAIAEFEFGCLARWRPIRRTAR